MGAIVRRCLDVFGSVAHGLSGCPGIMPAIGNARITLRPFRLLSASGIHRRVLSDWNPPG